MKQIFQTVKKWFEPNIQKEIEAAEADANSSFNILKSEDEFYVAFHGVRVSTSYDSQRKEYLLERLHEYRTFYALKLLNKGKTIIVPKRNEPVFKPAKEFKKQVNQ